MPAPIDSAVAGGGHATWADVLLWVLNHNGPSYALWAGMALMALWKVDTIITSVGGLVNGWRETSLKIRQFEAGRTERVKAVVQDVRDEKARLHISTGESG